MKSLSSKKERVERGLILVEGPGPVRSALEAGVKPEFVVFSDGFEGKKDYVTIRKAIPNGVQVYHVSDDLFSRMSDTESPQGVLIVAKFPYKTTLPEPLWDQPLIMVLVDVQDPGNAGTLMRIGAAAGANEVVFSGEACDPWSPKAIRASAGALFQVCVTVETDPVAAISRVRSLGCEIVMTVPKGGLAPWEANLSGGCALVFGNEGRGLRPSVLALPGSRVTIPMPGNVESLNVASAASMMMYEALRQRLSIRSGVS